jgi:photosystem II stability/assembly factor-like uncharacterized protein
MKKLYTLLFLLSSLSINAQWQYANFPVGGYVGALGVSNTTLFCTASGGVRTSTNNGANWQLNTAGIGAKKFVMNNAELYAIGSNINVTTDQGLNWKKLIIPATNFNSMIISLDTIYAATNTLLYKSIDKGTTWKTITIGLPIAGQINTLLFVGSDIWAGTSKGIYTSTDYGKSWTLLNTSPGFTSTNVLTLSGTRVFAGTNSQGLYVSDDNGITWTKITTGIPVNAHFNILITKGTSLYAGTDSGVYRSTDNGMNWIAVNNGLEGFSAYALLLNGTDLFAGTNYGLQKSTDNGANWVYSNNDIKCVEVYHLNQNSTTIFASTKTGIYSSTTKGTSWTWCYKNTTVRFPDIYNLAISGDTIYASGDQGVLRSMNNGLTWDTVNTGLSLQRNIFAVAKSGAYIFAAGEESLYVSTNNGGSWKRADTTGITVPHKFYSCLATNGPFLFAGTYDNGVFRSTDHGVSWTALKNGLPANLYVSSVDINGTSILIGTLNGVFLSTDNGDTWTAKNTGILTNICTANFIDGNLFSATYNVGDAYLSKNNGTTWTSIIDNLPKWSITTFMKNGPNVFTGIFGHGVWYRPLAELVTEVEMENNVSTRFQIYPNPNNGIFNFQQSQNWSTVEIFNSTGQRIYTSEITSAQSAIDLNKEAKGIYFVRASYKDGSCSNQKIIIR